MLSACTACRKHQFTSITDWTGGLYISPGFAGSRSGALIATAWASMVHLGEEGYLAATGEWVGGRAALAAALGRQRRQHKLLPCTEHSDAATVVHVAPCLLCAAPSPTAASWLLAPPPPPTAAAWHADAMMKAAQQFAQGIAGIDGLEVVGEPEMTVVAFKASRRQAGPARARLCCCPVSATGCARAAAAPPTSADQCAAASH